MAHVDYSNHDDGKWDIKNTLTNKKVYFNDKERNKFWENDSKRQEAISKNNDNIREKANKGFKKALAPKIKKILLSNATFKKWLKEYNPDSWDVYAKVAPITDYGKDKLPKKIVFGVKANKNGKEEYPEEAYISAFKMDSAPRFYEIRGGNLIRSDKGLASDILKTINTVMQAHGLFTKNYSVNTNLNEGYITNYFPY